MRLARRTRLAQGQGAADLKADASAAGLPANGEAAELRAEWSLEDVSPT